MGLVFDLAEALNLGWGAATGEAATSIREALADRAFRRAVVADVERSAGTSSAVLTTKVAKHPSFLAWLGAGAASPLDEYLDDDTLRIASGDGFGSIGELVHYTRDAAGETVRVRGSGGMTMWAFDPARAEGEVPWGTLG